MKQKVFKLLSTAIVFALVLCFSGVSSFAEADTLSTIKDEVVYAKLASDGSFNDAYIVNVFQAEQDGKIIDYGSYDSVTNLTSDEKASIDEDKVIFNVAKGKFYYQGDYSNAQLPWNIKIEYYLDGEQISNDKLAGATGNLEIHINITNNTDANKVFCENFALQVGLTLDTDICSEIKADDGTIAYAGQNKVITFTKLPGSDGDYTINMNVVGFEMDGIQINGIPLSIDFDLPDTSDINDDIVELQNGISDVNDGVQDIENGLSQMKDGSSALSSGLGTISNSLGDITTPFGKLVNSNKELKNASKQINDALENINDNLSKIDLSMDDINELTQGSTEILGAINSISGGLSSLKQSLDNADAGVQSTTSYSSVKDANQKVIAQLQQRISDLTAADPVANADEIEALTHALTTLTLDSDLINGFDSAIRGDGTASNPGLAKAASLLSTKYVEFDTAIQDLPSQFSDLISGMNELKEGVIQLVENYGEFNEGLVSYLNGVKDIYLGLDQLETGLHSLVSGSLNLDSGIDDLHNGADKLADGTDQLNRETQNMDEIMQSQIDDMLAKYQTDDFDMVSFASDKNTNVNSVQFIIATDAISIPESVVEESAPEPEPSFWDKLLMLFGL